MTIGRVDAIGDQSTAPGTSDFVIDGVALTGMLAFAGKLTDGLTYRYRAQNSDNSVWEVGGGVWTAATNTLSRVTTYQSSNGGAKANFTGTTAVAITMTAADFGSFDAASITNTPAGNIASTNVQAALNELDSEKQATLVSATNIKTVNGSSLLGAGDLAVGGSAAGSGTELQYRNAGAFAAMSGSAWDDTNRSLTLTGATVTTSKPIFDLSQTWNAGAVTFTGFKLNITNTASAAASKLFDFQVGGASYLAFDMGASNFGPRLYIKNNNNANGVWLRSYSSELQIDADGANTRGGVNALTFTAGNSVLSNVGLVLGTDAGVSRKASKVLETNAGTAGTYAGSALLISPQTVAQLPAASTAVGMRAFVTDASTTLILGLGTTVAGSGANKVPVYSDGTNWIYG